MVTRVLVFLLSCVVSTALLAQEPEKIILGEGGEVTRPKAPVSPFSKEIKKVFCLDQDDAYAIRIDQVTTTFLKKHLTSDEPVLLRLRLQVIQEWNTGLSANIVWKSKAFPAYKNNTSLNVDSGLLFTAEIAKVLKETKELKGRLQLQVEEVVLGVEYKNGKQVPAYIVKNILHTEEFNPCHRGGKTRITVQAGAVNIWLRTKTASFKNGIPAIEEYTFEPIEKPEPNWTITGLRDSDKIKLRVQFRDYRPDRTRKGTKFHLGLTLFDEKDNSVNLIKAVDFVVPEAGEKELELELPASLIHHKAMQHAFEHGHTPELLHVHLWSGWNTVVPVKVIIPLYSDTFSTYSLLYQPFADVLAPLPMMDYKKFATFRQMFALLGPTSNADAEQISQLRSLDNTLKARSEKEAGPFKVSADEEALIRKQFNALSIGWKLLTDETGDFYLSVAPVVEKKAPIKIQLEE